ncbi:MAG: hypothetical protein ACR2RF_29760 [Geminicoccaceae bacterium]
MSTTAKRLPAGDADDRSDVKITAIERRKANPPPSDDPSQNDLVVVPAQFAGDAQAASSFLGRFASWWSKLISSREVIAADYMRPNCGLPVSDQRAGVPFCARDNDSDRGGGSGSDGDPDPPAKDPRDDCKPR